MLPQSRFRNTAILLSLVTLVVFLGTVSYRYLEGWSWFDSFYMTILTLTTTGYGELYTMTVKGRLVSIVLMIIGVSIFLYVISSLTSGILKDMWSKGLEAMISKMKGHIIICGYGNLGKEIVSHLKKYNKVIIDSSPAAIEFAKEEGIPYILGDSTQEETLLRAGIKRAKAVVATMDSDAKNFVVSMVAKSLNPNITVIATAKTIPPNSRFWQASKADILISPYIEIAQKVHFLLNKPLTVKFIDVLSAEDSRFHLESIEVRSTKLSSKTIRELDIRKRFGVNVILIEREGRFVFPSPDESLRPYDKVYAIGSSEALERFERFLTNE